VREEAFELGLHYAAEDALLGTTAGVEGLARAARRWYERQSLGLEHESPRAVDASLAKRERAPELSGRGGLLPLVLLREVIQ
jgi:hypothetical protein